MRRGLAGLTHENAFVLALGFVLRCATLFWGLPPAASLSGYHPDEPKVWSSVYNFPSIYLRNHNYLYGTAWQYLIGLILLPAKLAVMAITKGHWRENESYRLSVIVATRLFGVFAGTLAIYLTWRLAARLFGRTTAAIAAALLTVSLYHCSNSAFATLDVPMSALLLLLFLTMARAARDDQSVSWGVCGAVAGVLMGMKAVAVFFAAAPLLLIGWKWAAARKEPGTYVRAAFVYAGVASVVLFVTTPMMFLHPVEFLAFLASQKREWYDVAQSLPLASRLSILVESTRTAVGTPVTVAFVAGAVIAVRTRSAIALIALITGAIYYCFWRGYLVPRFVIVVAPLFCMFAALFFSALVEAPRRVVRVVGAVILSLVLIDSLYLCVAGIDMRLHDTRPRASAFIAAAIPSATSVGVAPASDAVGWREHSWRYPYIDFGRYREVSVLDSPSIVVTSSYDLDEIEPALSSPKLLAGYRWDPRYRSDWYAASPPSPRLLEFYDHLLHSKGSGYRLIADFAIPQKPAIEFPPPEIRIYRRAP